MPTTAGGGTSYPTIPAPGSCTTPLPVLQKDAAGGGAVAGANGGATATGGGANMAAIGPVLQQLTGVIAQLTSAVGGVSGGGAPGKTPEQAPPGKTPGQSTTQAGGPATPAPTTPPAATPPASTVAGANGAPAANAAAGAGAVQGGGDATDTSALVKALQGVIEALNSLIKAFSSQVGNASGGGAPGKTPEQGPPGKVDPPALAPVPTPPAPPTGVGGENGPGKDPVQGPPTKVPTTPAPPAYVPPAPPTGVGGENGPGQNPGQVPPTKYTYEGPITPAPAPAPAPTPPPTYVPPAPPTGVGGQNGPGHAPGQVPRQVPPSKAPPTDVGGANGGPKLPQPNPGQVPTQAPTAALGSVTLDNDDERWSAKLTAKDGKATNSVELWGDPHVVINVGGKEEKFDIGFGAGEIKLASGNVISWDTYPKLPDGTKGAETDNEYILRNFKVDSVGTNLDRSVTTTDRDGDKGDQMGLTTALSNADLVEFAAKLRLYEGPMDKPLTLAATPAQKSPAQVA